MSMYKDFPKVLKKQLKLNEYFEKTTIIGILGSWITVIFIFGVAYYLFSTFTESHLRMYTGRFISTDVVGFADALYFSAVTGTALGFGDIIPMGVNKLLAAFESILGLILYGLLISKIVSVKQQAILEEVYELNFEDNILRLRSSLHVSRNDFTKVVEKLEDGSFSRKQQSDIWVMVTLFDTNLYNITKLIAPMRRNVDKGFARKLDNFRLELVLSSVAGCVQRMLEMYALMKKKKFSIKNEMIKEADRSLVRSLTRIINRYGSLKNERIITRIGELEKLKSELHAMHPEN